MTVIATSRRRAIPLSRGQLQIVYDFGNVRMHIVWGEEYLCRALSY
jgi:hypothetical protein